MDVRKKKHEENQEKIRRLEEAVRLKEEEEELHELEKQIRDLEIKEEKQKKHEENQEKIRRLEEAVRIKEEEKKSKELEKLVRLKKLEDEVMLKQIKKLEQEITIQELEEQLMIKQLNKEIKKEQQLQILKEKQEIVNLEREKIQIKKEENLKKIKEYEQELKDIELIQIRKLENEIKKHQEIEELEEKIKILVEKRENEKFKEEKKIIEKFVGDYTKLEKEIMSLYDLLGEKAQERKELLLKDKLKLKVGKKLVLDVNEPNWSSIKMENVDLYFHSQKSWKKIMDCTFNKTETIQIKIAPNPFAKGGVRYAYFAVDSKGTKWVYKELQSEDFTQKTNQREIETQIVSSYFAQKFNEKKLGKTLHFTNVFLCKRDDKFASLESFLEGDYIKFQSNRGYVNKKEYHSTVNTFSHFSYQESEKNILVVDLQGVYDSGNSKFLLTDPAINSSADYSIYFGATNFCVPGVQEFFKTHICNEMCLKLKLSPHPDQKHNPLEGLPAGRTILK
jgi:myosin heavy subunit